MEDSALMQAAELLLSCKKKNSTKHTSQFLNRTTVLKVKEQQHIWNFFDSKLSFEIDINKKNIKAQEGIGIINIFRNAYLLRPLIKCIKLLSVPL